MVSLSDTTGEEGLDTSDVVGIEVKVKEEVKASSSSGGEGGGFLRTLGLEGYEISSTARLGKNSVLVLSMGNNSERFPIQRETTLSCFHYVGSCLFVSILGKPSISFSILAKISPIIYSLRFVLVVAR